MEVLQGGPDVRICLGVETQTASHSLAGPRQSSLLEQSNSKQTAIRCGRCLEPTANLTRHWRQSLKRIVCSRWQEREAANVVPCGYIHAKQRRCCAMAGSDLSLTTLHCRQLVATWSPERDCPNGIAPVGHVYGDGVLLYLTSRAVAPASS